MIVKEKANCTITIQDYSELGLNSMPFIKASSGRVDTIGSEVHQMMVNHGMTREQAEAAHKENLEWAAA